MNEQCRKCRRHENDSSKLHTGRKVIVGNYCTKFGWNLDKVKPWLMKVDRCTICGKQLSRTQLMVHYGQDHNTKTPEPNRAISVPGGCYE